MLKRAKKRQSGQALIEFIMTVPLILLFIWYMVHVNTAINKSIVGQVSARSWLFVKLFNHSWGPETPDMERTSRSAFSMGVAKDVIPENDPGFQAEAPVERLGVGMNPKENAKADNEAGEPKPGTLRQDIRVRTAFGICTSRKTKRNSPDLTDFCGS